MDHRILFAPDRPVARAVAAMATISIIAALAVSTALAQQQPPKLTPAPAAPPAAQAKPPAAQPGPQAQPAQPEQQDANTQQMPQLMYSEWVKFCVTPGQEAEGGGKDAAAAAKDAKDKSKQVCLTGTDGRLESGQPIIAIVAIEPVSDSQKILRVTLPVGMHLQHGTRLIIDQEQPLTAPYVTCFTNGCISDYDMTADMLGKLKKGKKAVVQGINYDGSAISVPVPLAQFAKAHDGPPADLNLLAERQKKLDEGLKKKGEELKRQATEAQQKLERSQQGQTPAKPQ